MNYLEEKESSPRLLWLPTAQLRAYDVRHLLAFPGHCACVHRIDVQYLYGIHDCTQSELSRSDWQRIKDFPAITRYDFLDLR